MAATHWLQSEQEFEASHAEEKAQELTQDVSSVTEAASEQVKTEEVLEEPVE